MKTNLDACEQATIEYVDFVKSIRQPDGSMIAGEGACEQARVAYIEKTAVQFKIRNMDLSAVDRAYFEEVSARIENKYAELN